ncbi:RrF2 family transcriptional regulator [Velocimicrobium porci]|uniref:Rrf2 family transcriptional regulator n=1 Tax=Velocimicrobium porci TaxID=2606634 RepID=A0A6L5XUL3_9FIRM|nr:Rrf2 family transcriptional regulator [Velocimicrobium porci]MSS62392.1 Rrf2 family transcriptional regulator [Velocimicrobium porci]
MKISTKGRYALRVMLDLAIYDTGEFIPLKAIAERQGITVKYLEQIVPLLNKAGYLKSSRGNNGGYRLAKDPKEYTAGDILRITEGSIAPVACLEDEPNQCERKEFCMTLPFWQGLYNVINDYVDSVTLEDLVEQSKRFTEGDYCI